MPISRAVPLWRQVEHADQLLAGRLGRFVQRAGGFLVALVVPAWRSPARSPSASAGCASWILPRNSWRAAMSLASYRSKNAEASAGPDARPRSDRSASARSSKLSLLAGRGATPMPRSILPRPEFISRSRALRRRAGVSVLRAESWPCSSMRVSCCAAREEQVGSYSVESWDDIMTRLRQLRDKTRATKASPGRRTGHRFAWPLSPSPRNALWQSALSD